MTVHVLRAVFGFFSQMDSECRWSTIDFAASRRRGTFKSLFDIQNGVFFSDKVVCVFMYVYFVCVKNFFFEI